MNVWVRAKRRSCGKPRVHVLANILFYFIRLCLHSLRSFAWRGRRTARDWVNHFNLRLSLGVYVGSRGAFLLYILHIMVHNEDTLWYVSVFTLQSHSGMPARSLCQDPEGPYWKSRCAGIAGTLIITWRKITLHKNQFASPTNQLIKQVKPTHFGSWCSSKDVIRGEDVLFLRPLNILLSLQSEVVR